MTLHLIVQAFMRFRHSYAPDDQRADGLGDPGVWNLVSIGDQSTQELEIQVARSDWYEQVVAPMGLGSYLITPLFLPSSTTWSAAIGHLDQAARALTVGDPPAVFGYCRAAIDALPGAKTDIFAAMPEGKKRDSTHGAHYLAASAGERRAVAKQLSDLYGLRSRLVHGSNYPAGAEIEAQRILAEEFARHGLLQAVRSGFPTAVQFRDMVLGI